MSYAIDTDYEKIFVLEEDRELEDNDPGKPVFILKHITSSESARIEDALIQGEVHTKKNKKETVSSTNYRVGTSTLMILDAGLIRWENLNTKDGKEIVWPSNKISKDERRNLYSKLTKDMRVEIANAITDMNQLTEEDVKN